MESGGEQMLQLRELKRAALQGDHLSKSGWWVAETTIASTNKKFPLPVLFMIVVKSFNMYRGLTELACKMYLSEKYFQWIEAYIVVTIFHDISLQHLKSRF